MGGNSLEGIRVMVVEDEIMIALDISDALQKAVAEVSGPYSDLDHAIEAAQTGKADIAVLDIDLRGEEVFPAAHILRDRGVPFLFYTGRPNRAPLQTTFADVPVCTKPVSTDHLLAALGKLLPMAA